MCRSCCRSLLRSQPCHAGAEGWLWPWSGAGSPGGRGNPAPLGPSLPPGLPDVNKDTHSHALRGEQDVAPVCRGMLQNVIQLSNAGRRHETFPHDFFLHEHTREALQGGMHEPRTGGRGALRAPGSELLTAAAVPGQAALGASAVRGYLRGVYSPPPGSLCRTPRLGHSRLGRAEAGGEFPAASQHSSLYESKARARAVRRLRSMVDTWPLCNGRDQVTPHRDKK